MTSPPRGPSMVATTWELIPWVMVALLAPLARDRYLWLLWFWGTPVLGATAPCNQKTEAACDAVVRTTDTCEVCRRYESIICCAECKDCVCSDCACKGCYDSLDSPGYCDYCRACCPNRWQLQRATRCQYTTAATCLAAPAAERCVWDPWRQRCLGLVPAAGRGMEQCHRHSFSEVALPARFTAGAVAVAMTDCTRDLRAGRSTLNGSCGTL